MTADPIEPDSEGDETTLVLSSGTDGRDRSSDRVPFRLDDDDYVLVGIRPKKAKLLRVVQAVGNLDQLEDMASAAVLDELVEIILDEESVSYLRSRFEDDDDDLDLDVLEPIFKTLVGLWYGGPTGRRRGSSPSPSRTGSRSTVRSRSQGKTP